MTTYAVGDIHGNRPALEDLLDQLSPLLTPDDTVSFVGDYIDRGADAKGCIDRIIAFRDSAPAEVVTLRGNHEDWLIRTITDFTFHSWILGMEAWETIRSYSPTAAAALHRASTDLGGRLYGENVPLPYEWFFDLIPAAHLAFFQALETYHRNEDCVCTHAGLNPDAGPVEQQNARDMIWGARGFPEKYNGPDLVMYGHWNNAVVREDGWPLPRMDPLAIGMDTSHHGVVTAVRLPDRRIFQSARYEEEAPYRT